MADDNGRVVRGRAKYRRIPLNQMFVDDRYQRELSQRRVRQMAEEFDSAKIGALEVSRRPGRKGSASDTYAVFDGQHRFRVLEVVGETDAPCLVHEGLTAAQEAELFIAIQTRRKRPRAVEEFIARVFAKEPIASAINQILLSEGIEVGRESGGGVVGLNAVKAAERVFEAGNLKETLSLLTALWKGERKSLDANLIEAMSFFLALYGPKVKESALLDALSEDTPVTMLRRATAQRYKTGGAMRDLLVEEFRSMISSTAPGGVLLKRPPLFERAVAIRHLRATRRAFEEEAQRSGKTPRLTQWEVSVLADLRSNDAGAALRTLQAVGQVRQSGKKKLPNLPESDAFVLEKPRADAPPS